ncbi:MAG: flippase-like domain-containing protein [Solirubrobacterales bacterium]|nr:flippase-like domain-containing protein [Solirubrobacterales bacterium]
MSTSVATHLPAMMSAMVARDDRQTLSRPIPHRIVRIVAWVGGVALGLFVLDLLGVPVRDWIHQLFKELRAVPPGAIVGGCVLEALQTVFAALSWLTILRVAFPEVAIPFRPVLASYAVAVALNSFLPANIGTLVMMLMLVTLIAGATFAAIFSGFIVQKIPFTVFSVAVYVYLFATVSGSLALELGFVSAHPAWTVVIVIGTIVLLVLLGRFFWHRAAKLREQVTTGGAVLAQPRRFMVGVVLPAAASFASRLGIVAVFLAAFSIPVTFHTVMAITGANSVSSSLSVTPGGVGVTQALNVLVLESVTSSSTATAYSLAQQLIVSAADVVFGVVLVCWVFGWSGGKDLVRKSYAGAEVKRRELKERRDARRAARGGRWRVRH